MRPVGESGVVLIVILVIAAVAAAMVIGIIMWRKRRQALRQLASSLGFTYSPRDMFHLPGRFDFLNLFNIGHSRRASNVIHGSREGADVFLFDYRYVTGSGKNQTTHSFCCCVIEVGMNFPYLWIRRERWYDKITSAIGFDDIDFESHEFSRKFYVKSESKKFAYEVINQQMMEYLLRVPQKPYIEMRHDAGLFYFKFRWKVDVYRYLYEFAFSFLEQVPDFVLEKYSR